MPESVLAAVVQMTSRDDVESNLGRCEALVRLGAARGARLVVLPENFAFIGAEEGKLVIAEPLPDGGPILARMAVLAREAGVYLVLGGMPERSPEPKRAYNACVLVAPDGKVGAVYRKIHLFDVDIEGGVTFEESRTVAPGDRAIVAETPFGKLGLSVCYDLRFPELYRRLVDMGATTLAIPAAFTLYTGKDHWNTLLRARAIENQCYVLAAAQFGTHAPGRQSYGKASIIDPWGTVVACAADGEGIAVALLDPAQVERVRRELPALRHRRADLR